MRGSEAIRTLTWHALCSQVFFIFQNKSTNILFEDSIGAYVYSKTRKGGFNGQGQVWWEAK